jgi:APA family basic amino acid/polyamine antiporter
MSVGSTNRPTNRANDISASAPALRKELNLFDAISIVVGTIIGSGIFLIPNSIAIQLNSLGAVLAVWVIGGIVTIFGALSLAELGSMYPGAGGLCNYLREAYGPLPAFLYAWGLLLIIHSGSIAALAAAFAIYAGQIFHLNTLEERVLSAACILMLTAFSCLGVRGGKLLQNLVAVVKVGGLTGVILLLALKGLRPIHLFEATPNIASQGWSFSGFAIAMVAVLWTYEAWHVVSFVGGEMKRPQFDLPRALAVGCTIVMLIYVVANLCYYHVLSAAEIRSSQAVAALAVGKILGPFAQVFISILILISILGSMNGMILTGPRVYYAMGRDGVFPRIFGKICIRYQTPILALVVQGIWAAALAASGTYQQLFTDVIFTAWIFYGLAVAAVIVLRHARPEISRPFRVPGYPWVCLLFCAAAVGLVASTVVERPAEALIGIGLVATGTPVYWFYIKARAN